MKIDLHCHTRYSYDCCSNMESLIRYARKKGVDGIAITDHDTTAGWKEALALGRRHKFHIILGEEIKTKQGDILGLFLSREIKNGKNKTPMEVITEIKEQGGLAFIPHPFHPFENFRDDLDNYVSVIDGVEIFNARCQFPQANGKAGIYAQKHALLKSGGSDAHFPTAVGDAYTESETASNLDDFKKDLLKSKTIVRGRTSAMPHFFSPAIGKIYHYFQK
ncbi:MAG TPA: PHP domain-containing protein [Candidatus Pacearchaeota archaeon]|nr:PHP domain-containing protein [Candidatus Pacearchaeota archaeon]